jgi:hypothetical protein
MIIGFLILCPLTPHILSYPFPVYVIDLKILEKM